MKKILSPKLLPVALALAVPLCASAQTTSTTTSPDSDYRWGSKFLLDYEHLTPTEHNRHIDTDNIDVMMGRQLSNTLDLSIFAGLTATHASGHITRNDGQDYDNTADGLGPSMRVQIEPWHAGNVSLALFASGGLIFYNEDFPSQGRSYNFMWRVGPTVNFKLTQKTSFNAGASWMHVSNGRETRNPGYDGSGVQIGLTHSF